ncbi:MAG: flagellar basal body rod protein FlgB [Pseudomonadota bacterium]|nr:flagellar basal body rod protein FlgB [Pseudomonadota bacterium]
MTINRLFDNTSDILVKAAQLRSQKAEVIAGNIANLDTPGYQAKKFEFAETLRNAAGQTNSLTMRTTNINHLGRSGSINSIRGSITVKENTLGGLDRNSVNLDQEMAEQAINNSAYNRTMQMLKNKMSILKTAIVEGGK